MAGGGSCRKSAPKYLKGETKMPKVTLWINDNECNIIKAKGINFELDEVDELLDFIDSLRIVQQATAEHIDITAEICFNPLEE